MISACTARWTSRVPLSTRSFGVTRTRASVSGMAMSGSWSSTGWITSWSAPRSTPGGLTIFETSTSEGSIEPESISRIVSETARSSPISCPLTSTAASDELPEKRGTPLTHWALASALAARTRSSSRFGSVRGGISASSAGRRSTRPSGVFTASKSEKSGSGSAIGSEGSDATPTSATAARARATWSFAGPASGPSSTVPALSAEPDTPIGSGGTAPPPATAARQSGAPRLATAGSIAGAVSTCARSALASHVQPAAAAPAGQAANAAMTTVSSRTTAHFVLRAGARCAGSNA